MSGDGAYFPHADYGVDIIISLGKVTELPYRLIPLPISKARCALSSCLSGIAF